VGPHYEGNKPFLLYLSQLECDSKIGRKINKNTCNAHMMHAPSDLTRSTDGMGVLVSKW